MVEELMRDFAVSATILGNLSAFYFYSYASIQIPIGVLLDRYGPRRLMTGAAALVAAGCALFATSDSISGAYLGRLLIGAGCAFSWVGTLAVIGQWLPPRRFALFTGMTQFCGMAGAIFGQAPIGVSVTTFGWRPTLLVLALGGALLALLLWLAVRDRRRPVHVETHIISGLRSVIKNPQTWLTAAVGMALTGPVLAFAGLWGVPYMTAVYGMEKSAAAASLATIFIGWALGAPLLGWLSDRLGRRKPLLLAGGLLSTGAMLGILYIPNLNLFILQLLFIASGVGGASMILTFATAREHSRPDAVGAAIGVVNMAVVGSGALFQPLIGWLLDVNWSGQQLDNGVRIYSPEAYAWAFAVLPLAGVLGVLLTLAVHETHCRQRSD
jgi:MFS family permease